MITQTGECRSTGKKKGGEIPRPGRDVVTVIVLCGFNLADFLRELYRFGRQLIGCEIVNVNAAQTAGFRTAQNIGFILID